MQTAGAQWPTRMNAMDALFWTMDKVPELRSTIGALFVLERPPTREALREEFAHLSTDFVRMHQRVVEVPWALAPPEWVDDTQFDLDYHLRYLAVPAGGGLEDLLAALSPLFATSFDRDRPLWEAYVAEGLRDGRGAVLFKMHHCMVDGVGSSRLMETLLGERNGNGVRAHATHHRSTNTAALLWRAVLHNVREGLQTGTQMMNAVGSAALEPTPISSQLGRGLRMLTGISRQLLTPPARSPLQRPRSMSRQLSTFEMSLRDIDALRAPLAATINDVVLTVVSGAMQRWHAAHGTDVEELRALVPVNLRSDEEDSGAGNRIAMLTIALPVGEPDPLQRLRIIQERVGEVKTDRRAKLYPLVAGAVFRFPLPLAEAIARQQTTSANFVCTNVPGPRGEYALAGVPIEKVYPFTPLVGDHPLSIALFSYRNTLYVGLDIDPLGMDDVPRFREALQSAYTEVLGMASQIVRRPRRARAPRRRPLQSRNGNGFRKVGQDNGLHGTVHA